MPAGVNNPVIGYLGFCAVKLAGYSVAGFFLSRSYSRTDRNSYLVGGVRTLIGMAAGLACYGLLRLLPDINGVAFVSGLIPVRIAEWWFLLWLFCDRQLQQTSKGWRCVAIGTLWSFLLDLPALIGFLVTGGLWIC